MPAHYTAIAAHGPCEIHRRSFQPIRGISGWTREAQLAQEAAEAQAANSTQEDRPGNAQQQEEDNEVAGNERAAADNEQGAKQAKKSSTKGRGKVNKGRGKAASAKQDKHKDDCSKKDVQVNGPVSQGQATGQAAAEEAIVAAGVTVHVTLSPTNATKAGSV